MAIERLSDDRLQVACDDPDCPCFEMRRGSEVEDLLRLVSALGWHVSEAFGLQYCGPHTIRDRAVCGAGASSSIGVEGSAERQYYCAEHWPL